MLYNDIIVRSKLLMSLLSKIKSAISNIFNISHQDLTNIEEILIEADFGVQLSERLVQKIKKSTDIDLALRDEITKILSPFIGNIESYISEQNEKTTLNQTNHIPPVKDINVKPFIITLCGPNGCGKTTTIAKLIRKVQNLNLSVAIAACDTFRAAADIQLETWASKLDVPIYTGAYKQDPASVAYQAVNKTNSDILLIDTAGRLTTNANLMQELAKIYRVVPSDLNILVLDSTIGQSAIDQVTGFNNIHKITGTILTKMDGKAKGGMIVNVIDQFKIPILGVCSGEQPEDFEEFSINKFLDKLLK